MTRLVELDQRSREVFRLIVDAYVETGEPIGSRTLSRRLGLNLSPATIRNVMADLEESGLLFAPHTSAGRLPTEAGLRLFVDGLLEVGRLTDAERETIDSQCAAGQGSVGETLEAATSLLSGLSHCAGLVMAPKSDNSLKHIEFVSLGAGRALVVMVTESGLVENRVIELANGTLPSSLVEATNYLNARLIGRTLDESLSEIRSEIASQRSALEEATRRVVEAGIAVVGPDGDAQHGYLIVNGRHNLLEDVHALEDLETIRALFEALERKETAIKLLEATGGADGVQIFIGAESGLFGLAGCSTVLAPYMNGQGQVVGAIGVIGPTRINYARIIPMVDYTAQVVGRMVG